MRVLTRFGRSPKWLLAGALVLALIVTASCGPRTTIPRGWSGPVVAGDRLYVGTMDGRIVGVDLTSGQLFMNAKLENGAAVYGGLLPLGKVYVGAYIGSGTTALGRVYAFAPGDNQTSETYPAPGKAIGGIVGGFAAQGPIDPRGSATIYFGTSDGRVYALNDRLQDVWSAPFTTRGKIWAMPGGGTGTLYVGSFDRNFYAINASDGTKKWEFKTGGAIIAAPVFGDNGNTVYVGAFDRKLYALDANTGTKKWEFRAESWFWAEPTVANGMVYAVSINGWLHVLAADNGREVTKVNLGGAVSVVPVLSGNTLVIVTEAGAVLTVDVSPQLSSLTVKTVTAIGEKVYGEIATNTAQDTVYVHTQSDKLYAINLATATKTELPTK